MNYQVFDEENDDDDQVVVNFMANDLDLILEPSRMSSQAWTHHQKKMKKDQKKMKGEKKRVKMIEDTCFPIVQYIMKEFQDHLMVKWPCEQSSYYMQRQPKGGITTYTVDSYREYLKSLNNATRTWVILSNVNKTFRSAVKDSYYLLIKMIADQNRETYDLDIHMEYGIRHPMTFLRTHLLTTRVFCDDTDTNPEDVDLTWAPNVCIDRESGFTRKNVMYSRNRDRMLKECEKFRSVYSYLVIAYDKRCKVCKMYAKSRPLFGNMDGWRMCRTCKRNKLIEISTFSVRYGIQNLFNMQAYKDGIIKMCLIHTSSIDNILYIDPSAIMMKPTRRMFWVDLDSIKLAFGGEEATNAHCKMVAGLRKSVYRLIEVKRAKDIRDEYVEKFAGGRYKAAGCRNMDKFASNSQKVYNTWLKRSPNQYYIAATSGTGGKNNDESYVPGLCGLPERLVSLRYYMSSSVFGEIQKIEAVAEKRKKLAIRMDGGEVGIEKEYEKEVKGPLPYVVPLKSNRRDYRRGV